MQPAAFGLQPIAMGCNLANKPPDVLPELWPMIKLKEVGAFVGGDIVCDVTRGQGQPPGISNRCRLARGGRPTRSPPPLGVHHGDGRQAHAQGSTMSLSHFGKDPQGLSLDDPDNSAGIGVTLPSPDHPPTARFRI